MLGRAADALRVWIERDAKLTARIEELSIRLDKAEEFDESRVTELLGVETARIVAAARDAAAEIRGQAASESAELLARSKADAEATSERLISAATAERSEASKVLADAQSDAAETTSQANDEAERVLSEARAEADRLRTDASEEAERTRTEASETAETLTSTAQERHDEMIAAASKVLEEQTNAAEASAAEIRSRATGELEEARSSAAAELERAGEEARGIVAEAEADAQTRLEVARDQGRAMVEEARDLRRQMLNDIAERSRAGRQKVEAAKAARAEVLRMIRSVGTQVEGVVAELDDHDPVMRREADGAAAAVPDDTETTMRELEAQLMDVPFEEDSHRYTVAGEGVPQGEAAGDDSSDGDFVPTEPGLDAADLEEVDLELEGPEGIHTDDEDGTGAAGDESADHAGSDVRLPGDEPTGVDQGGEDLSGGDVDESQMASVHDLFQKLRSEDHDDGDAGVGIEDPDGEVPGVATVTPGAPPGGSQTGSAGTAVAAASVSTLTGSRRGERSDDTDADSGIEVLLETDAAADAELSAGTEVPDGADESAAAEIEVLGIGDPGNPTTYSGILDRRDELLEPAEKLLARTLKRLFSDEQNEVFDRVRRHKRSRIEVSDLLGESDDTDLFVSKLTKPYLMAASAGAVIWGELSETDPSEPTEPDLADALASQVGELLGLRRAHLRESLEAHAEAGGDSGELVDRLRSAYRELRTSSIEEHAGDLATGGFAVGTKVAAGPGSPWCWVPDNGGLPCADAEDNALAGALACGSEFPTGDVVPPAHPGCRCIVVPDGVVSTES